MASSHSGGRIIHRGGTLGMESAWGKGWKSSVNTSKPERNNGGGRVGFARHWIKGLWRQKKKPPTAALARTVRREKKNQRTSRRPGGWKEGGSGLQASGKQKGLNRIGGKELRGDGSSRGTGDRGGWSKRTAGSQKEGSSCEAGKKKKKNRGKTTPGYNSEVWARKGKNQEVVVKAEEEC